MEYVSFNVTSTKIEYTSPRNANKCILIPHKILA